jgi:hypothetical protein
MHPACTPTLRQVLNTHPASLPGLLLVALAAQESHPRVWRDLLLLLGLQGLLGLLLVLLLVRV